MNKFVEQIKGKRVLVFGLGRQGGGSGDAAWLEKNGAIVKLSDKDLSLVPEGQTREQIDWADVVLKNPGVPDNHELLIYAKSLNKPVLTSAAIFVKYCGIKTLGVTGTRGKSTTVALIAAMLEQAFPHEIISGGNIAGTSCFSLFDQVGGKKYAVLELSSFQLHNFHDLRVSPNISVITNLYPDHLNRYPDMDTYQHDKEAMVKYQGEGDITLFNIDNVGAVSIAKTSSGKAISFAASDVADWEISLPGLHNRENIAAMFSVAQIIGISVNICMQVAKDFKGVPFRQEKIRSVNGIAYINDTTATTPVAAIKALQAATTPTIWITGGDTKNLPYSELIEEVKTNHLLKAVVILGSKNIPDYIAALTQVAGDKIIGTASSMDGAVKLAGSTAVPGDSVLLSPGYASFDLFQNEFDRGRQFNDLVREL